MTDPLSVTSGVAGLIALVATTTQSLITIISDLRDAPADIQDVNHDVHALSSLIRTTDDLYQVYGLKADDAALTDTFNECLSGCLRPMKDLEKILQRFSGTERGGGRRSPMRVMMWTMRKGEIRGLRDRLRDSKASLTLAVSVFNGHVSGKGQDEIKRDIRTGYEELLREFSSLQIGIRIRDRLEGDVTSISGRRASLSNNTDAGIPMQKFLATGDEWENVSAIEGTVPTDALTADDGFTMIESPTDREFKPPTVEPNEASLLQAVSSGNTKRITQLLEADESNDLTSERTPEGLSALHVCVELNDCATTELLLKHGMNMNLRDKRRRTPFMLAIDLHSVEVACLLIERGCALGTFTTDAPEGLKTEEYGDDYHRMLTSLSTRLKGSARGPFLLHRAIQQGQTHYLKVLVDAGFDVNERDEEGTAPLHHAIVRGNMDAAKALVEASADVNCFLAEGPHPTLAPARDRDYTPLLLAAAARSDAKMVRYLISHGADPNFVLPKHHDIVLQCVCAYDASIGAALIEGGTNVNHQSEGGHTPLYWACVCRNVPLLKLILQQPDVNINVQTYAGEMTAAHACVQFDRKGPLRVLLQHKPDLTIVDAEGLTALDVAEGMGRSDMIDMLRAAERAARAS
ncbi:ankyrin [Rhizodiscina lignyota]|uniref:Ankyrin n=1 Tax=Rhizodiscina lignyota TaxID=1504668 RepID=A0A9P4ILM0_9PEZI|nr:ankyrin [Rhizodiscina lignyota]